ncbi:thermonuclease family protein [Caulobacter sp. 73W]|uniref:Thermonuclease family protein n=1 Tax=Caulobacter sp. 73W TaxID=3161137 RepID=A0AB39KYH2_9CAUL
MRNRRGHGSDAQRFFRTRRRRRALRNLLTQRTAGFVAVALIPIGLALNAPAIQRLILTGQSAGTAASISVPAQSVAPDQSGPPKTDTKRVGITTPSGDPVGASSRDEVAPDPPVRSPGLSRQDLISGADIRVVDGDTIRLPDGERVRILNIDTPEMPPRARCEREGALALQARDRTQELVLAGDLSLLASGRNRDRYGRLLRRIEINGRDLGEQLISEGLAQRWSGSKARWC